jgi:DNA invertase Pin-like site-specific DNA recombinase
MIDLVQQITDKIVIIRFMNESWLDTSSPSGELMLAIFDSMAQFERKLMLQRCAEVRVVAVAKGVKMGIPKTGGKQLDYALELYKAQEMPFRNICEVNWCGEGYALKND